MKKPIFIIAALCAATACLTACNKPSDDSRTDGAYNSLNTMLGLNYSTVSLTVTNTFDEQTSLVSEYIIKYSDGGVTVSYSVERFAEISFDVPLSEAKITVTGETNLNDGGADGDISAVTDVKLNFKKEYFSNADITGIYLKADVTDASAFFGAELSCTDMRVEATFLEIFYDLKITYTTDSGCRTEMFYVFTL